MIRFFVSFILIAFSFSASATTLIWTNIGGGSWNNALNWSPRGIPGPLDTAIITNGSIGLSPMTVTLTAPSSVGTLILGAAGDCFDENNYGQYLSIAGQSFSVYDHVTVNACGALYLQGGTLVGASNIATLYGNIYWTSGQMNGTLSIGTNSTLGISGADHDMPSCTLSNYGNVAWASGRIRGGGLPGSAIYNYGTWDSQADLTINSDFVGDGMVYNNFGVFLKSGGTGGSLINSGVVFNSSGNINLLTGPLTLTSGGQFTGGSVSGSNIVLLTGGGFNINGTVTSVTNMALVGGLLVGDNVLVGGFNWSSGNLDSATSVTVTTNTELDITSGVDHDLSNCQLTNNGIVEWLAGRVRGGGIPGTVIINNGLWDIKCDFALNSDIGTDGIIFNNAGTLRKSVTTGTTTFNFSAGGQYQFNNTGLVDVQSGALVFACGGTGGIFNAATNTSINFTGGYNFISGSSFTGPGTFVWGGGAIVVNGVISFSNLLQNGGSFAGGNITLNGMFNWNGGNWNGANSVTITTNSQLNIGGGVDHDMANCSLTNYGTVNWSSGRVRGGGLTGSTIYNYGLWDSQADLTINSDLGTSGTVFNNIGTFRKSGGAGTTLFNPSAAPTTLINTGLIDVQTNFINLSGGGQFTGGSVTGSGNVLLAAGSFNINNTVTTVGNMTLAGGLLVGDNSLVGGFTWSSGNLNSASSVTITTNTEFDIVSGVDHDLSNCRLTNNGTVEWFGGRIRGGGLPGTTIYNKGLWDIKCDFALNSDVGGVGLVFNNSGTLRKSVTTGTTTFLFSAGGQFLLNNTGLVDVESGAFVLTGSGTGGTFNAATNTSINFNGGYNFVNGSSFTGPGPIVWGGGTITVNGTITFGNLLQTGGSFAGGNIMLNGMFNWNGGNWNGATSVTISTNSQLNIGAGVDHDMANCSLTNYGTVNWSSGRIRGGGIPGSKIYNYGLWDSQSDLTINSDLGVNGTVFNNLGTFRKSGGTGTTLFNPSAGAATFNNTGAINIVSNIVNLAGGGQFMGGSVTGAGILYFSGGTLNIKSTAMSINAQLVGSTLVGTNILVGGLTWSSGNWNSTPAVTVTPGTELDIVSGADHDLVSCKLVNNGLVEWLGGRIRGGGNPGTIIANNGIWETKCDFALNNDYGVNGVVFSNAGTFRKSTTTGATTVLTSAGGLGTTFTNVNGAGLELYSGTLSLPTGFSAGSGPVTIGIGGTGAGQTGLLSVNGLAFISGPLKAVLTNNFALATSNQFQIVSSVFLSGVFNATDLPAGIGTKYTNNAVFLVVTNAPAAPVRIGAPQIVGANLDFSFPSTNGQSYTIQVNTNLVTTNWVFFTNVTGNGSNLQIVYPITNTIPQQFFRIREP